MNGPSPDSYLGYLLIPVLLPSATALAPAGRVGSIA